MTLTFKIGDKVFHAAHGVGHIVGLGQQRFGRQTEPQLYYEVAAARGTVWVPAANMPASNCLRYLTTKSELSRYRQLLKSSPTALDRDRRKRQLDLSLRLKPGSFQAMCEVVRDLTALSWHKPLNESDALMLQKVRQDLCQEWAAAADVPVEQAREEIEALLKEARQIHLEK